MSILGRDAKLYKTQIVTQLLVTKQKNENTFEISLTTKIKQYIRLQNLDNQNIDHTRDFYIAIP